MLQVPGFRAGARGLQLQGQAKELGGAIECQRLSGLLCGQAVIVPRSCRGSAAPAGNAAGQRLRIGCPDAPPVCWRARRADASMWRGADGPPRSREFDRDTSRPHQGLPSPYRAPDAQQHAASRKVRSSSSESSWARRGRIGLRQRPARHGQNLQEAARLRRQSFDPRPQHLPQHDVFKAPIASGLAPWRACCLKGPHQLAEK